MRNLIGIAVAVLAVFGAGAASAQTFDDPKALLEHVYENYQTAEPALIDKFYSTSMKALFAADEASHGPGEMGALEFDPIVNGQDFEITDVVVADPENTGTGALVPVSFNNFGDAQNLLFHMVEESDGWKIDDIEQTADGENEGWVLSQILASGPMLN